MYASRAPRARLRPQKAEEDKEARNSYDDKMA